MTTADTVMTTPPPPLPVPRPIYSPSTNNAPAIPSGHTSPDSGPKTKKFWHLHLGITTYTPCSTVEHQRPPTTSPQKTYTRLITPSCSPVVHSQLLGRSDHARELPSSLRELPEARTGRHLKPLSRFVPRRHDSGSRPGNQRIWQLTIPPTLERLNTVPTPPCVAQTAHYRSNFGVCCPP